ncbi:hypothetical protein UFOVP319_14 [uncultured Caudovirales phage]|uniref:Uncharacterized protein n=1 Tax=uncultured Caudovirales phage TaxID=2100421 RepID=A0A6J5LRT1_9CAUD|nr:hypothetical protein UFOVP319_14 [uncultured Caudovirales phage]
MTPLTKEQADALAEKFRRMAVECRAKMFVELQNCDHKTAYGLQGVATFLDALATEIRNGTFIEVQP